MSPRGVVAVSCPCCDEQLYRTTSVRGANGKAMNLGSATNPSIDHDKNGEFMKCSHCRRRISMKRLPEDGNGAAWDINPIQKCDRKLA